MNTENLIPGQQPTSQQAPFIDYAKRDLDLYNTWKQTGSKQALGALVKSLHPLIYSEVRRSAGTLPEAALSAEAKKWAVASIQSFDPSKGAALSTHVVSGLRRVRRINYANQNSARLPENLHLMYQGFKNAASHLETSLGREPTDVELAKELSWTPAAVTKYKKSLYEDLTESANARPTEITQFNSNAFLLDHVMSQLDDQEKTILMDSGTMPASQLADKLGVNISRLNYLKSKTKDKIQKIKTEIGMF